MGEPARTCSGPECFLCTTQIEDDPRRQQIRRALSLLQLPLQLQKRPQLTACQISILDGPPRSHRSLHSPAIRRRLNDRSNGLHAVERHPTTARACTATSSTMAMRSPASRLRHWPYPVCVTSVSPSGSSCGTGGSSIWISTRPGSSCWRNPALLSLDRLGNGTSRPDSHVRSEPTTAVGSQRGIWRSPLLLPEIQAMPPRQWVFPP